MTNSSTPTPTVGALVFLGTGHRTWRVVTDNGNGTVVLLGANQYRYAVPVESLTVVTTVK